MDSPLCWLCVCMAPAVTGSDRIRLEWNGSVTPPKPIHIPDGFEVWNYEGNRDVLPGKWEALTQAAFSDGKCIILCCMKRAQHDPGLRTQSRTFVQI